MTPPPDACTVERTLHAALLENPRQPVAAADIAALADADARENWQLLIAFRDHLLRHATLEAAYLALARGDAGSMPPLFLNQMVHAILRNALDDCADPFVLRAAEMMFRPQRLTVHEGALVAADDELIAGASGAPVSPLVSMLGLPAAAGIDVLTQDNADAYWERSDRFDMALDVTAGRRGLTALGEALARFLRHMLALEATIEPLVEMRDVPFTWYVGLDAEGTRIGDALWNGGTLDAATAERVVALYRMTLRASVAPIDGPIYLILSMTPDRILRMKPQNILAGLPVRTRETVS